MKRGTITKAKEIPFESVFNFSSIQANSAGLVKAAIDWKIILAVFNLILGLIHLFERIY